MTPIRHHLAEAVAAVDARLSDPDWHPSEQDVADAWAALGHERAARQFELLTNTPPSTGSHAPVSRSSRREGGVLSLEQGPTGESNP